MPVPGIEVSRFLSALDDSPFLRYLTSRTIGIDPNTVEHQTVETIVKDLISPRINHQEAVDDLHGLVQDALNSCPPQYGYFLCWAVGAVLLSCVVVFGGQRTLIVLRLAFGWCASVRLDFLAVDRVLRLGRYMHFDWEHARLQMVHALFALLPIPRAPPPAAVIPLVAPPPIAAPVLPPVPEVNHTPPIAAPALPLVLEVNHPLTFL